MKRKIKDNNFTTLELHQMKVIDELQEEIKILKTEITKLNKDKLDLKRIINIKEDTNQRLKEVIHLKELFKVDSRR